MLVLCGEGVLFVVWCGVVVVVVVVCKVLYM